jgi:hypothetical protein
MEGCPGRVRSRCPAARWQAPTNTGCTRGPPQRRRTRTGTCVLKRNRTRLPTRPRLPGRRRPTRRFRQFRPSRRPTRSPCIGPKLPRTWPINAWSGRCSCKACTTVWANRNSSSRNVSRMTTASAARSGCARRENGKEPTAATATLTSARTFSCCRAAANSRNGGSFQTPIACTLAACWDTGRLTARPAPTATPTRQGAGSADTAPACTAHGFRTTKPNEARTWTPGSNTAGSTTGCKAANCRAWTTTRGPGQYRRRPVTHSRCGKTGYWNRRPR